MLCKECNNTGHCVWCDGTGRGRMSHSCDRCRGSGMCFSCGGAKLDDKLVHSLFEDLCKSYKLKVAAGVDLIVQFTLSDLEQSWVIAVRPDQTVGFKKGAYSQAKCFFKTDTETLRKIYAGEMTALTAAGKGGPSEPALLQISLAKGTDASKVKGELFTFIQQFFNKTTPEKIVLTEKHTRKINGVSAIPLYNSAAQKSAWYMLRKGDRLNDNGQSSPFPQSFIFVDGEGFATIGEETVKVKTGESYYIPPNNEHVVWNENKEPLVLISLSWSQ